MDKHKKPKANEKKVKKGANHATKLTIKKQCPTVSKVLHIVTPPIESSECSKDEL
jgi:hypothetical protein